MISDVGLVPRTIQFCIYPDGNKVQPQWMPATLRTVLYQSLPHVIQNPLRSFASSSGRTDDRITRQCWRSENASKHIPQHALSTQPVGHTRNRNRRRTTRPKL